MQTKIIELIEDIKIDYLAWTTRCAKGELSDVNRKMIHEFAESMAWKEGKKYTKIVNGGSVWGFVMQEDDAKFKKGDILMAAGYNAPARNKARGNVFTGYSISWTGPNYLK